SASPSSGARQRCCTCCSSCGRPAGGRRSPKLDSPRAPPDNPGPPSSGATPMRLVPVLLGAALMTAPAPAIDPAKLAFDKLPSNPGLPDPLTTFDGKKVTTKEGWFATRRPELKGLFQDLMYGRYPAMTPKVSGKVVHEDKQALGGKATLREVALTVADGA